jgi:hypothetical protein
MNTRQLIVINGHIVTYKSDEQPHRQIELRRAGSNKGVHCLVYRTFPLDRNPLRSARSTLQTFKTSAHPQNTSKTNPTPTANPLKCSDQNIIRHKVAIIHPDSVSGTLATGDLLLPPIPLTQFQQALHTPSLFRRVDTRPPC